ncbi:hypothetical protein ACOMHN_042458 [Nucella lapillus]
MPFRFKDLLNKLPKMSSAGKNEGQGETAKPVTCILIGAGSRGFGYAYYGVAFPKEFKIVGVADPREFYTSLSVSHSDIVVVSFSACADSGRSGPQKVLHIFVCIVQ